MQQGLCWSRSPCRAHSAPVCSGLSRSCHVCTEGARHQLAERRCHSLGLSTTALGAACAQAGGPGGSPGPNTGMPPPHLSPPCAHLCTRPHHGHSQSCCPALCCARVCPSPCTHCKFLSSVPPSALGTSSTSITTEALRRRSCRLPPAVLGIPECSPLLLPSSGGGNRGTVRLTPRQNWHCVPFPSERSHGSKAAVAQDVDLLRREGKYRTPPRANSGRGQPARGTRTGTAGLGARGRVHRCLAGATTTLIPGDHCTAEQRHPLLLPVCHVRGSPARYSVLGHWDTLQL